MSQPTPERLAAWRGFLEAHARVTDVLEAELQAERGLPLAWYDVLVQLSESADGALRMQELARRVLLSKSGLTRLVDRMEQAGLVRRGQVESDRRGALAVLTPAGRDRLRNAAPVHLRGVEQSFTGLLTDDEAVAMRSAFAKICAALPARDRPSRRDGDADGEGSCGP